MHFEGTDNNPMGSLQKQHAYGTCPRSSASRIFAIWMPSASRTIRRRQKQPLSTLAREAWTPASGAPSSSFRTSEYGPLPKSRKRHLFRSLRHCLVWYWINCILAIGVMKGIHDIQMSIPVRKCRATGVTGTKCCKVPPSNKNEHSIVFREALI
ncbi:hypothetical protein DAEQUDRAFT_338219 [Daedalea quercina L-15889]|uniref:Uncharacterized protein n=1 Tax=Daedalea quercina L-15889 TaxID=1314783 RepID=A0A165PJL1_9APHY|nr:hypothetical protein DAEQUDRAFT_338219 [Daedalea quercina L-15889]